MAARHGDSLTVTFNHEGQRSVAAVIAANVQVEQTLRLIVHCQLSIVNCQFGFCHALSTVEYNQTVAGFSVEALYGSHDIHRCCCVHIAWSHALIFATVTVV